MNFKPLLGLAVLISIGASTGARAEPITFLAQPPLPAGDALVLERIALSQAPDGPGPEDANETSIKLTTMLMVAPLSRLTLGVSVDYVARATDIRLPTGERIERSVSGLGDLSLMLSSGFTARALGGRLITAPFASVKIPTGTDDESDDFGRLPQQIQVSTGALDVASGVLAFWCRNTLEVHAASSYTLRTEANEYNGGDRLRVELGAQECIAPWNCNQQSSTRLYAALESRVVWQAADRGLLAPTESGGINAYIAPGLRAQVDRHSLEAVLQIPVHQPYDQHVRFAAMAGYRFRLR